MSCWRCSTPTTAGCPTTSSHRSGCTTAAIAGRRRVGIVACDAYVETPDGERHGTYGARVGMLDGPITLDRLLEGNPIFVSALVPRALVAEVGGFSTETWGSEDHDLWLRIVERGYEVAVNPRPLVIYREAEGSVSASRVGMARTSQATYRRALDRGQPDETSGADCAAQPAPAAFRRDARARGRPACGRRPSRRRATFPRSPAPRSGWRRTRSRTPAGGVPGRDHCARGAWPRGGRGGARERRAARRPQPRLPRPRRDRRHGDLRPRADPAAGRRATTCA